MGKFKINEVVYQILMHHINHYQQVKKIFKIDYDSQMILVTVYAHYLYQTLNLSLEKKIDDGLDWEEMFPVIKGLSREKKKDKKKLSLFSVSQILNIPKESVRRKVIELCKKKYLDYSNTGGLSMGENYESTVKKIAPKDMTALEKVIKTIDENGGISLLLKSVKK